jgi:signal transduction histidine kinase
MSSIAGSSEKTEIVYGSSNVLDREILFFSNAKLKVDTCMDYTRPSLAIIIESIRKSFLDAKSRDVKLRYITEITTENILYCKELMKIAELRHLDGIKGNFMVSEKEYIALVVSNNTTLGIASQIIYSNLQEIVEQQNYIFDTLWNKAIPAIKKIREIEDKQTFGITEVLYGSENAVGRGIQFMKNVKKRMDICFDSKAPSIIVEIDAYRNGYKDIRNRGAKIRAFTEITKENIHYCKELTKLVDELRHLEGMKGGIAVSEKEYMATTVLQEATPLTQVIYSNIREVVDQMQYIFDVFWHRAIPAEQKIRQIEEGIVPIETRILEDPDEIFNHMKHVIEHASKRLICSSSGAMEMVYENFFDLYKKILDRHRREGEGIRWITTIDKDNKDLVKIFLNAEAQIRHLKSLPPMNFAVDDKYFHATIEKMEGGKMMESLLTSNEPIYINHFNSLFEELWKNGIDAVQRIRDIEEGGTDLADIEVIQSASRAREIYLQLVKQATKEILFIFPTANAFSRQYQLGAIELAEKAATERNVKVRILMPTNKQIDDKIVVQNFEDHPHHKINIRDIEQMSETKATILVVDRKESLVMELRDDSKTTYDEAIGLSTYSNSKAGVLSYVAIFENLWKQSELYEELKITNRQLAKAIEQLKVHDKMQKDFINIAAHELRTPIQPILSLSEIIRSHTKDMEQAKLLDVVNRNAKRLKRLTEDILDVTKIDSQSLNLKKEKFNLNDVIVNSIDDIIMTNNDSLKSRENSIKLQYHHPQQDIFVQADKGRISQVIHNLLDNALKFTETGNITISAQMKKEHDDEVVIVNVKDTGRGLDPGILPRLFSKFATKSDSGTGLGLFISKSIIESHGGRIWAENNNKDGEKGATFYFTLPLSR